MWTARVRLVRCPTGLWKRRGDCSGCRQKQKNKNAVCAGILCAFSVGTLWYSFASSRDTCASKTPSLRASSFCDQARAVRRLISQRCSQSVNAAADTLLLSTQVLQDFYVTVTRKLADPLPPTDAVDVVRRLSAFSPTEIDAKMIVRAAERSETDMLSLWDALIVEAALAAGAERIFSEDMQDGRNHSGIVIHNPF
ncbi:MAG: PIN domain-containing protein [Trueperaceae bacterium]